MREYHVRICERLGGRFPRSTRFILMGEKITKEAKERLAELLDRMGLILNEAKTQQLNAKEAPFKFLGFEVRYDKGIRGRGGRYWNIVPATKSEKKVRENISVFLKKGGHYPPERVAEGLNAILRGWINYFDIPGVSYPAMSKRKLRYYLIERLYRYYNRKSQRRSRLHGKQAYDLLVKRYRLIEPTRYSVQRRL